MTKKLLILFIFLMYLCFNINAGSAITIGHITIAIENDSLDKFRESEDFKFVEICNKYIDEYYPKIKFPIYFYLIPDSLMEDSDYRIQYNNWGGTALIWDKKMYNKKIKEYDVHKIGIAVTLSNKNIQKVLQLLDYGINKESYFKKKLKKIRKQKGHILAEEDSESFIIYAEELNQILDNPPNSKISNFLETMNN